MSAFPGRAGTGKPTPQAAVTPDEPGGVDLKVLVPALALVALGVAMVFSASIPFCARPEGGQVFRYLWRELLFLGVGLVAMWGVMHLPLEMLRRASRLLMIVTAGLLIGLFPFGTEVNGSKCWYSLLGFRFQPSEMAKMVLVIAFARYFARFPEGLVTGRQAVRPLAMLGLIALLIAVEPDMGTAAVMIASMFVLFHIAGMKLRHLAAAALPGALAAMVMILTHPYQLERIKAFFVGGPEADLAGGYQMTRSLIALGSGGPMGRGYFQGVEKFYYLPEVTTDSILPVIGEELGFAATAAVVALFAVLVWRGMVIARKAPERFPALVAAGVTCCLGVQALLNIAVATGSVPATGVTLPFVSYGGSSLLFSMIGIGLLLNVSRTIRCKPALRVIR